MATKQEQLETLKVKLKEIRVKYRKLYLAKNTDLFRYKKIVANIIVKHNEKIVQLKEQTAKYKKCNFYIKRRALNRAKKDAAKRSTLKKELNAYDHLVAEFNWDKDINRAKIVEVILRSVVTYNRLLNEDIIDFNEFSFLLVGCQMEAFDINDVENKVGKLNCHRKSDFLKFVEIGLFKKVYRKKKWHITVLGRDRFNEILRYIYENKIGTYRLRKKYLIEE